MACNWAPHNLNDVAKCIADYLDGNSVSLPGPDFPTGGLIINKNDIPKIMETGHGTVKIRARYTIEKDKIIFYEIPYGTTIEGLIEEVGEMCEKKEIEGISDIHDESSKKIRIVITCEKGIDPEFIVKKLYQKTDFQTSFSYNQVALVDKTPTELNLKDAIKIYVDHNIECIVKECKFDLVKAQDRLEIVDGLLKALEDIDNIIALIKKSESAAAAKENLISRYKFTENQAKAILAMRLSSLAKLEKIELEEEQHLLEDRIKDLQQILTFEYLQKMILRQRLGKLVEKYGDERRTEITQIEETNTKEQKEKEEVIPEDVVVILYYNGNIKRVPKKNFKTQRRNGVGVKTKDDAILGAISTSTTETLLLFGSTGKMYLLNVNKIPEGTNASKGVNIKTLCPIDAKEDIQAISNLNNDMKNVIFFTKNGLVKRTQIEEYTSMKKTTGIQSIKLKEGDSLINTSFINDDNDILYITKKGLGLRISSKEIRTTGRITMGVKGITLKTGDEIVAALPIIDTNSDLVLVTKSGKGKKIKLEQFNAQSRGTSGSSCIKLEQDDYVAAAALAPADTSLLFIGKPNSICIKSEDIPTQTKTTAGAKVIERSEVLSLVVLD